MASSRTRNPMTPLERRATSSLAAIMALRMLGLFLMLPVLALYAEDLRGHTPFLVGLAMGIYGLTQAVLQIPFAMASDRLGRKQVIVTGLLIFAVGSAVAALAHTIEGVIIGRAIQGAGAVSAAVIALVADLTRNEQRTKAMAFIGISIGSSFIIAMLVAPPLQGIIGVPGIFWATGGLALGGIVLLLLAVPAPQRFTPATTPVADLMRMLRNPRLRRFDLGIFTLHATMTAVFLMVPTLLKEHAGLAIHDQWKVLLPAMVLSVFIMLPLVYVAERYRKIPTVFPIAIVLIIVSQGLMYFGRNSAVDLTIGMMVFFGGFNVLEALLPSLVSRAAPPESKGAAMGVYNSSQFIGVFVGGAVGGWLFGTWGAEGVVIGAVAVLALWLLLTVMGSIPLLPENPGASAPGAREAES
jgi:predicted MFS family arabinose efflux permease